MSDERIEAAMTREEMIAHAAWHIDKHCTGGTDEDWDAAEQIIKDLVDPLLDRSRDARSEDECRRGKVPASDPHQEADEVGRIVKFLVESGGVVPGASGREHEAGDPYDDLSVPTLRMMVADLEAEVVRLRASLKADNEVIDQLRADLDLTIRQRDEARAYRGVAEAELEATEARRKQQDSS